MSHILAHIKWVEREQTNASNGLSHHQSTSLTHQINYNNQSLHQVPNSHALMVSNSKA